MKKYAQERKMSQHSANMAPTRPRATLVLLFLNFQRRNKIRHAACSASRVRAHCIFCCIKVLHALGEVRRKLNRGQTWACWGHVGTMLAHFSLLGVFFSLWNASRTFVGRFFTHGRLFFRVLGGSGSDVWASRDNFEGPKLLFLVFCRPRRSAMRKNCACAKTTVFPVFLYGFYILRALSSSHKTTQNHSRGLFNRASCKDCAPVPS